MPYQAQLPLFNRQAVVVQHFPGDLTFPCETSWQFSWQTARHAP